MRQGVTILFVLISSILFSQTTTGLQTYITDSGDTVSTTPNQRLNPFPPPSPQACASGNSHATPYNQNNGQRGIMFDITALNNIIVNCFEVNMATGTTPVAIYYKVGTHVGFANTPGAWTLIGTVNTTGLGNNVPTPVNLPVNVNISAGCTVAFYITRTTAGGPIINYTNGTAVGFVYSANADLQVKDGTGKDYPFGASFTPRRFNGTIFYTPTAGPGGGTVTGPTQVCAGASVQYVFNGAGWTSYNWTVPAGTVITAGQGTQTITVTAGSTPGNICCTPTGPCGPGAAVCLAVTLAPAPTATQSHTNVLCNGGNTGSATITPNPAGAYTYVWSPNVGSTATVSNLVAGSYTVTATNSGGCSTTQTITVTQPPALTTTSSQTDLTCNGINNGSATVNPSGGAPFYNYAWSPSGGTSSTANNLSAQNYTCTITDANGCTLQQTFTITAPSAITLVMSSTPSTCGSPNGTASVAASGGTGGFTYLWQPSGGTASTDPNLVGGTYSVTVTDGSGCTAQGTVAVVGATTPSATITGSTNILCNGNTTGDATVLASGGSGPYTYAWAPSGGTGSTESNLGAGTYTVTITDGNSCTATATVTLTEPPALTSVIAGTDILCFGGSTGSATITPSGGAGGDTFVWSPSGGNANIATGLTAQSYTCVVTDMNGCTTQQSITLTEPPLLTTTFSQVDELCQGANNGSATVNPAGGAGGYTYTWAPSGGNANTASNIYAGQYTVTITDVNGCSITQSFNITEPQTVILSQGPITNVDCFGNSTGSASLNNSGGTLPYGYNWTPNASTTNSATNLAAGNYVVVVTDANGCSATITLTVTEPPLLTVQASAAPNTICSGATVNLSANGGGGVQPYQFAWLPGPPLIGANQTVTPTTTTTYTVGISDANGCSASTTTNVTVNPVPVAAISSDVVSGCTPVCVNFTDISTVAAPGTITAWDWDFGDGSPIDNTQNPSHCYTTPGQYTVTLQVKTADGCVHTIVMTNYIEAWVVPVADFTASPQPTTIFNAEIFFTDLSVNADSWQWSFGDVFGSSSTLQHPSFTYLEPNCYVVQLDVATSNGCTSTDTMSVCLDGDVAIHVPNAFTPNGNGLNEVFIPKTYGIDPQKYEFWVFDRWGNQIFHTTDINAGWDGTLNGTKCQIDTYVYRVYAWDVMGNPHRVIGGFSLIR